MFIVRAKHFHTLTREEKEWASIDRLLHPEIWRRYGHTKDLVGAGPQRKKKATDASSPEELISLGKILGGDSLQGLAMDFKVDGHVDLRAAMDSAQRTLVQEGDASRQWECSLDRDEVERIWRSSKDALRTDEERFVFRLLMKYNGTRTNVLQAGVTNIKGRRVGANIQFNTKSSSILSDPDARCHLLLREIDRASTSKLPLLDSEILHGSNQRFPPEVLRLQLESELDRELAAQVDARYTKYNRFMVT
jgi:hypothetical protein